MKQELRNHLLPLLGLFIIISLFWFFNKVPNIEIIYLFIGLLAGSFFLDIDHFIFWFFLKPNIEESRLVQSAFEKKDIKSVISIFESTHKNHHNLIFHHYFFQVVLILISFFIFTSSNNTLIKAFLLALNIHILTDEIIDFYNDKKYLQKWLFAREGKQLSIDSLKYYILTFVILIIFFTILLLKSRT
ncbi:MAG: hypothetical protein WCG91_02190 [Candidatus Shapirobacteria bacterium]